MARKNALTVTLIMVVGLAIGGGGAGLATKIMNDSNEKSELKMVLVANSPSSNPSSTAASSYPTSSSTAPTPSLTPSSTSSPSRTITEVESEKDSTTSSASQNPTTTASFEPSPTQTQTPVKTPAATATTKKSTQQPTPERTPDNCPLGDFSGDRYDGSCRKTNDQNAKTIDIEVTSCTFDGEKTTLVWESSAPFGRSYTVTGIIGTHSKNFRAVGPSRGEMTAPVKSSCKVSLS